MLLKKSVKKRALSAARKLRSGNVPISERHRMIRLHAAEFVAESEQIEGAAVTAKEILNES